jgi:hypothetical protein
MFNIVRVRISEVINTDNIRITKQALTQMRADKPSPSEDKDVLFFKNWH